MVNYDMRFWLVLYGRYVCLGMPVGMDLSMEVIILHIQRK